MGEAWKDQRVGSRAHSGDGGQVMRAARPGDGRRRRRRKTRIERFRQVAVAFPMFLLVAFAYVHGSRFFEERNGFGVSYASQSHASVTGPSSGAAEAIEAESTWTRRKLMESENSFPDDAFSKQTLENGAFMMHAIGMLYTFFALAIVCDEFFVPSLEVLVARLGIPEDVAGATFMAAGGSAPELWTSFIGIFVSKDEVGFGTIVGSAVFNILFVIGSCAFASKTMLTLTWWPLSRDVFFYSIALVLLTVFFYDDKIYLYEGVLMFSVYIVYVIFMCYNDFLQVEVKAFFRRIKKQSAKVNSVGDTNSTSAAAGDTNAVVHADADGKSNAMDDFKKGSIIHASSTDDESVQIISASDFNKDLQQQPAAMDAAESGLMRTVSSGATRQRGFSDPSDMLVPASGGSDGDRYVEDGGGDFHESKRKKRVNANNGSVSHRSSTGTLRQMNITRGSRSEDDPELPPGVRRGRRMSETGRMLLMERGNGAGEDGRLSYVNVLHEGGLSFARQKFQISVMKSMIPRTESVSEKMVRTAKAATAVHKLDKQRRESEGQMQDGMGGLELKAADSEFYGSDPEKGYHGDCADGASTPIAVKSKSASGEHGKVMPMDRQQMPANGAEMSGDEEAEDGCDDGSGGDALDLSFPDGAWARALYIITAPITYSLYLTVPDVRRPEREDYFPVSFVMSILWIIVYTFCMVWWATVIGQTLGIPSVIMGLTVLAAGTSVPDLLTSVIVAQHGHGDMAVSSSIGSNLFDVCIGLPVPWIIYNLMYSKPVEVGTSLILISVAILFVMLIATVGTIAFNRWQMTKTMGAMMFGLYVVFMVVMILLDGHTN